MVHAVIIILLALTSSEAEELALFCNIKLISYKIESLD